MFLKKAGAAEGTNLSGETPIPNPPPTADNVTEHAAAGKNKWTIHVISVEHATGAKDRMLDQNRCTIELSPTSTIKEFIEELKKANANPRRGNVTIFDLSVFDK